MAGFGGGSCSSQSFSGLRCYDRDDDRGVARDARADLRRRGLDLWHRALELRLHRFLERLACGSFARCKSTATPPPQAHVLTAVAGGTPRLTPSSLCSESSSESKSACDSAERDAAFGAFWSMLTSIAGSGPRLPMCMMLRVRHHHHACDALSVRGRAQVLPRKRR